MFTASVSHVALLLTAILPIASNDLSIPDAAAQEMPANLREPTPAAALPRHRVLPLPTPAEVQIEEALKSPTTLEFVDTPLKEVIDYLKDLHHIQIQLDTVGLKEASVDPDVSVTKNVKNVSLASGLDIVLGDAGLGWEIRHETLWITSPKRLAVHRTSKIYDVIDLVAGDPHGRSRDGFEPLVDLITTTVSPDSWRASGPPLINWLTATAPQATIKGATLGGVRVLSVSATYAVHRELAEYLANVRRLAGAEPAAVESEKFKHDKAIVKPGNHQSNAATIVPQKVNDAANDPIPKATAKPVKRKKDALADDPFDDSGDHADKPAANDKRAKPPEHDKDRKPADDPFG